MDEPAYDASSRTYAMQLSVLVESAGTKVGALTFTLRIREDLNPTGGPK